MYLPSKSPPFSRPDGLRVFEEAFFSKSAMRASLMGRVSPKIIVEMFNDFLRFGSPLFVAAALRTYNRRIPLFF